MASEDKCHFGKMIAALHAAKADLPNNLGQVGQTYFQRNFNKSQWDGEAWEPRKTGRTNKKGKFVKYKENTKHLLVKTGKLRQSLQDSYRKSESNYKQVVWGTDITYAKYQNDGTEHIPKRQFLGSSKELNDKFLKTIKRTFDKVVSGK